MTVPGSAPGESRTVYFAKLPFGGEAMSEISSVISESEAQYRSNDAAKEHFQKLEVWAQAFAQRAKDFQRAHSEMTDFRFRNAEIRRAVRCECRVLRDGGRFRGRGGSLRGQSTSPIGLGVAEVFFVQEGLRAWR